MGRVIAVGAGGKAQAPERDDSCRAVIEVAARNGLLGRPLLSPVCPDMGAAARLKSGLYRSARYFCSCGKLYCTRKYGNLPGQGCPRGGQRISCQASIVWWTDPGDGKRKLKVQFTLFDKAEAVREVVRKYGPDPNKWPYYSRRKQLREDR